MARQARNETLHREVNERRAEMDKHADAGWAGGSDELFEFLCECGAGDGCTERVEMKLADYERVREQDDRFAVAPGHELPEIERIVERGATYLVVDKVTDVEECVADDPRGAPSH